jgi:hypothetical protein
MPAGLGMMLHRNFVLETDMPLASQEPSDATTPKNTANNPRLLWRWWSP